jgi:hypothetical protein
MNNYINQINQNIKDYLVIVYSAGDNDLRDYLFNDLDEIEEVGSNENIDIVAIADQGKYGNQWQGCRILHLQKDTQKNKINSPVIGEYPKVDMSDPKFLEQSLTEVINKFPAKNIMLVISDHGSGWEGVIVDNDSQNFIDGFKMTLPKLRDALKNVMKNTNKKIDIITFDACLMGSSEVMVELKDVTNYVVASQQLVGAEGLPYKKILTNFYPTLIDIISNTIEANKIDNKSNKYELNKEIVKNIVKNSQDFSSIRTISAIDINKTNVFIGKLDELAKTILKFPQNYEKIKEISKKVQKFNQQGNRDLIHFLMLLIQDPEIDNSIKEKAIDLKDFLQREYIISSYNNQDFPNAYGLSIILGKLISYKYKDLVISKETSYDEMLQKIFN